MTPITASFCPAAELLDLLGAAARIEAGRFEPQLREFDSPELVDAAVKRFGKEAKVEGGGAHVTVDAAWDRYARTADAEPVELDGPGSPAYLYIGVDDVEEATRRLHEAGAKTLSPHSERGGETRPRTSPTASMRSSR
jgi:hypothetical protein